MSESTRIELRPMTADDIQFGMHLKNQAGWNQTPADWARFLNLQPDGCFVAELDGRSVGTVANFVFGSVGWIAMLLVDEPYRHQGIGRRLMREGMQWLESRGVASIRLDATPLGRPLYESLGFVPQFILARYAGEPVPVDSAGVAEHEIQLCEYRGEHLPAVLALDREVVGVDRARLVERLVREQPESVRLVFSDGELLGYVAARPGSRALQLGPCLARSRPAGERLLADALSRYAEQPVFIDVPLDQPVAERLVTGAGLQCQRHLTRMTRGVPAVEQVSCLWASSGPEKG